MAQAPFPKPQPVQTQVGKAPFPKPQPAPTPFSKAKTVIPPNPNVTQVVRAKPIAQTIVHRPQVTGGQTRVAQSLGTGMGICPQSLPQPFPPIPPGFAKTIGFFQNPKA